MSDTRAAGDDLLARLRAFVGRPGGTEVVARDPVNVPMIRHWCDAVGDRNAAYDPDRATATRHGDVIAPPAMLQTWCMDRGADDGGVVTEVLGVLADAGFTSVVATNYDQEYARPLRPGDRLREQRTIEDVSALKRTALGEGHFVTILSTYRDETGEVVGTSRMRVLRFRPASRSGDGASVAPARRPRPVVNRDTAFFWEGVGRGELLVQRCGGCAALRHPPAPMCPHCNSLEWSAVALSGRGSVRSWVVHHHPPLPGFDLPVTIVLADLEEGVRFVAEYAGPVPPEADLPVRVEFVQVDDELTLPRFRPAGVAP